jgi:hypothetical protein
MNFADCKICPDCGEELSYPEKCGTGGGTGCGWFKTVIGPVDSPQGPVGDVKARITEEAQKEAEMYAELRGRGQSEYEPRFIERIRREALGAFKALTWKSI